MQQRLLPERTIHGVLPLPLSQHTCIKNAQLSTDITTHLRNGYTVIVHIAESN